MTNSITQLYETVVLPKREELFGVKNAMSCPRIKKVVLNARIKKGGTITEEVVSETLSRITGQKPVVTKAKKSISNFKIREGMPVGAMVTLRGKKAIDFLDRLIHVTLPRVRDFQGLSTGCFDKQGNYTLGLTEHIVFPEVATDDMGKLHGLQIVINTTATNKKDAHALLSALGFPFKK